ncbi:MAG: VWA domain-containing protein [Treponema sp.]|nr:VWA domain-containing protein [Treponema sp.]
MKKAVAGILLLLFTAFPLFAQSGRSPAAMDVILVLDTSSSMSAYYRQVRDYITGPFLRENLRLGDTFHLISFGASAQIEISRRVREYGDLETIIGRLFLMIPLEPYSDIATAMDYTEKYVAGLPPDRPKRVILLSDGIQNPAPGGRSLDAASLRSRLDETAARLSRAGAEFRYTSIPLAVTPQKPAPVAAPAAPPPEPSPEPPVVAAEGTGTPEEPPAPSPEPPPETAPPQLSEPPMPLPPPQRPLPAAPPPEPPVVVAEGTGTLEEPPVSLPGLPSPVPGFPPPVGPLLPAAGILLLAAGGLLALRLGIGRLYGAPQRALADALRRTVPGAAPMPMLSLFVEDQNSNTGLRNIHALKAGKAYTLGGGDSDFLIFLAPLPRAIGEIRFNGSRCDFIPRKARYFPDLDAGGLAGCTGKTIRVISDKRYEINFRLDWYSNPAPSLPELVHAIRIPGK